MQYDSVGNVTKIVDGVNSETIDYTYDELNRLLTASVPAGESFVYDTIGNMTSKSGAALDYGTTSPKHAVKSHGSTTYTYDVNGSMTARGTQTIKYDPERRPIRIQDGTSIHRSAYDGDGVRRKRMDSNGTVHYLGGYERKLAADSNSSDTVTKYYSASFGAMSRPLAFRRGGTLHWVGSDHLGGTIRVMDSSFTALDGMRYKPYGEDRDAGTSLNTDRKFTGQTEDETAGLYWYASRAYDPAIGRFVSPDSIVPDPSNPQSLNRYAYVYNNPLKFIDPSGHSAEWYGESWRKEFYKEHGQDPNFADYVYRRDSMETVSRGDDWSVQHWADTNYNTGGEPRYNHLAREFFSMAKQGGLFHDLSAADQAAIQFNIPEGVDLAENIRISNPGDLSRIASAYTRGTLVTGPVGGVIHVGADAAADEAAWLNRVRDYGAWDYKRRLDDHEVYQDFGNFNFGVTGAARGHSLDTLLAGAWADQTVKNAKQWGLSKIGWDNPLPADQPFLGDQPRDVAMIKLGYAFYTAMQRGR